MNQISNPNNIVTMTSREATQYLYVCLFSNGHIKVGRSVRPNSRISAHASRVSCIGVTLIDSHVVECIGDVYQAESELISHCRSNATEFFKREWFCGVDFLFAVSSAEKHAKVNYQATPQKQRNPEDEDRHQKTFARYEDLWPQRNSEMESAFVTARVLRDAIALHQNPILYELKPVEKFGGLSEFELLAGIFISTSSGEDVARLMHEACEASNDDDLFDCLIESLRDNAINLAKESGVAS